MNKFNFVDRNEDGDGDVFEAFFNLNEKPTPKSGELKCSICNGTGQSDGYSGMYHGICHSCSGTGKGINHSQQKFFHVVIVTHNFRPADVILSISHENKKSKRIAEFTIDNVNDVLEILEGLVEMANIKVVRRIG